MPLKLVSRARLRRDRRTGEVMLLWPERGMALNESAARVVELLVEGQWDLDGIVAVLAEEHPEAARGQLVTDVRALVAALEARALVVDDEAPR